MPKEKCYTFTVNYKEGIMLYKKGQRIMLDDKDYEEMKSLVVPTDKYKGPPMKRKESSGCGCK